MSYFVEIVKSKSSVVVDTDKTLSISERSARF